MSKIIKDNIALVFIIFTTIIFYAFGDMGFAHLERHFILPFFLFVWLFGIMLWSSFLVVHHADALALKLGEPFGTLILTLSVISIEVILISAIMLTGVHNPTLGRDMMFSVLMIALNGLVGLSLLLGGIRHLEQRFNLQGANTFFIVLVPLAVISLIIPSYTRTTLEATFSTAQNIFLILISAALYGSFLLIQTLRHREYFMAPKIEQDEIEKTYKQPHTQNPRSALYHTFFLFIYMIPIVLLSKKLAIIIDYGTTTFGAPSALGGLIVALLVLSPEGLAAINAATANQIQRSINICLGSALATIGLTVPAILLIGLYTDQIVVLGLEQKNRVLLVLTLFVSYITFSNGKSNVIQGIVHLVLFACYIMLIFD